MRIVSTEPIYMTGCTLVDLLIEGNVPHQVGRFYVWVCFELQEEELVAFTLTHTPPDETSLCSHLQQLTSQFKEVPHNFITPPFSKGSIERFFQYLDTHLWSTLCHQERLYTLDEVRDLFVRFLSSSRYKFRRYESLRPEDEDITQQDEVLLAELTIPRSWQRILTQEGIRFRSHLYWHPDLAMLSSGTPVTIIPFSTKNPPESIEVFSQEKWICSAKLLYAPLS